jgi:hypothetical protein
MTSTSSLTSSTRATKAGSGLGGNPNKTVTTAVKLVSRL